MAAASVAQAQAPTISPPIPSQVGANQVTLTLRSGATGTGYFTLLPGESATPGTGAQVAAGQDSAGAIAYRFGSLRLQAGTDATYTVRNLPANSAFTVCFTADDGAALQPTPATASFTTAADKGLVGATWTLVGPRAFSASSTIYSSLAFAPDGTPYVGYKDMAWARMGTVMRFSSGAWQVVGTRGLTGVQADWMSVAFAPDGTPYFSYSDNEHTSPVASTVMTWDGSAWSAVGSSTISLGQSVYTSMAFGPDGAPYVAFADSGRSYRATVLRYNGSAWTSVGAPGFTPGTTHWVSLKIAPDGTPYIGFANAAAGNKANVMRFDGTSWVSVGSADFSLGESVTNSLAIAPDGTPYLAYTDRGPAHKATVMKFSGGAWSPVGSAEFTADLANYTSLAIAPDGAPWLAYADAATNYHATVMRFDGSTWTAVGGAGFTTGDAAYTSLAFAPDGTAYLAFQDVVLSDRMTVMKLQTTTVPAPAVSSVAVPATGSYAAGQNLSFTVNFDAAVTVTGTPRLALTLGGAARNADYVSGSGTTALVFRYTVQSGDDGALALGSAIAANGGTIVATSGSIAATLTLAGVGSTSGVAVDTSSPAAPVISGIAGNVASGTAEPGSTVHVSVDGSDVGTAIADGNGAWTYTINTSSLAAGQHTVSVRASDAAGNSSTATSGSLTVSAVSYTGDYFGGFSTDVGTWALHVRADSTATFLAHLDTRGSMLACEVNVGTDGTLTVQGTPTETVAQNGQIHAGSVFALSAQITGGRVAGQVTPFGLTLTEGQRETATAPAAAVAGCYSGDALYAGSGTIRAIVAASGRTMMVMSSPQLICSATGTANDSGALTPVWRLQSRILTGSIDPTVPSITVHADAVANLAALDYLAIEGGTTRHVELVNFSARSFVSTGDAQTILGFSINGTGTARMLARAIGPTLTPMGVNGALADPALVIKGVSGSEPSCDDWSGGGHRDEITAACRDTGAFLLPEGSSDAALVRDFVPGSFTSIVSGVGATTGVALSEIYVAERATHTGARVVNFSARGFVGVGDAVMIPGFVIDGNAPCRLLVRAIGPTLATNYQVNGALADPVLAVVEQRTHVQLGSNDDWDAGTLAVIMRGVGAFTLPSGSLDAAIVVNLPPNAAYTILISGKGGTTGVALAEIYVLP